MSARDDLAATIYAYTPLMTIVQDGHRLAVAIIKAGWVSPAEVRLVQEAAWDEGWDERDNDCSEPYSPHRNNPYATTTEEKS